MLRAVASLLAPPLCALCRAGCVPERLLCSRCERRLDRLSPIRSTLPGGLEVVSAVPYDGVGAEIVSRLKFSARLALATVAAERMVRSWGAASRGFLVPVPPAPARHRARGFDPASMLATLVARSCPGAEVAPCLARDDGPRQVGRARETRTSDPPRVRVRDSPFAPGRGEIWLVDDVATTGATLSACASALREAGVESVRALTFARADH